MKKPRIEDFDPNAKIRPLGSPLDGMPAIEVPTRNAKPQESVAHKTLSPFADLVPNHVEEAKNLQEESRTGERPNDATPVRANTRTPERVHMRRIITRNSFEIYEDQMDALREQAYKEKMQGKVGSMSQMVREAIDTFLTKRRQG